MSTVRTLAVILAALASLSSCSKSADPDAQRAADKWLALVDGGQYAQSWTEAASYFKAHLDSPAWEKSVGAVHAPLGSVQSRVLKSATPAKSLPGAPDGEYVVFQFDTSFEKKQSAVETVTPMRDTDGAWRVSGYYIK